MKEEILRLVDTIHRSKEIEKEIVFLGIEAALESAVRRKFGESDDIRVEIDRETGDTLVFEGETAIDTEDLGRLAAMTGKQVLFQKIREAERDRIFEEFEEKVGTLVSGVVQRQEGPNLIVNLGRVEGFLPRSEQAPGERFQVGERIKVVVKDIRKNTSRVKLTLSRTDTMIVRALFELEVPEIADKVIEIKEIAREPGYRTKIAVTTYDNNVDCVGACVGVRGSRIKNIVDELFGEKIDIVRWNESIEVLIMNALKPAEISTIDLDFEDRRATIYVKDDQQSLAIGKRGQNVRLASKLSEWELDIQMITDEELEQMRKEEPSAEETFDETPPESPDEGESAAADGLVNETLAEALKRAIAQEKAEMEAAGKVYGEEEEEGSEEKPDASVDAEEEPSDAIAEADATAAPQPQSESPGDTEVEPESGGDTEVEPESGGDTEVEPESGGDTEVEPESGGDTEVEPEASVADSEPVVEPSTEETGQP